MTGGELLEVHVVVEDLAGVVEYGSVGVTDDFSQNRFFAALRMTEGFPLGADDQFVQVVNISLEVLSMMELESPGTDHRLKSIDAVR